MEANLGIFLYATRTPVNFEMDIPSNKDHVVSNDLDIDSLYREAVNYGNNGKRGSQGVKGSPGPSVKTTVSTQKFEIHAKNLIAFKAKVQALPDVYEEMSQQAYGSNQPGVVDAERRISVFKQTAARLLKKAEQDGISGYANCVSVLEEINTKAVKGLCKVEFFMKRVDATEFEGSNQGKDGLFYRTDKLRKFYVSMAPTADLLERIIKECLVNESVAVYNNEFRFVAINSNGKGKPGDTVITMKRVGYETLEGNDKAIADTLSRMRRPKLN